MRIDRCVCEAKPFGELLRLARRDRIVDAEGLARVTGCGTHCGWCVAYIRRMLVTGESVFHEVLPKERLDDGR